MVNASPSTHTAATPLLFSRSSVKGPSCYVSWPMLDWAYQGSQSRAWSYKYHKPLHLG